MSEKELVVRQVPGTDMYGVLVPFTMIGEIKVVEGGILFTFREKTFEELRETWESEVR